MKLKKPAYKRLRGFSAKLRLRELAAGSAVALLTAPVEAAMGYHAAPEEKKKWGLLAGLAGGAGGGLAGARAGEAILRLKFLRGRGRVALPVGGALLGGALGGAAGGAALNLTEKPKKSTGRRKELSAKLRLRELAMVSNAVVGKFGGPVDRVAFRRAFRRKLEKMGNKKAVRAAFGVADKPATATAKHQHPKIITINGEPAILSFRGINKNKAVAKGIPFPDTLPDAVRKLKRPYNGWLDPSQRPSTRQALIKGGGLQAQPNNPTKAAISTTTNPSVARDYAVEGNTSQKVSEGVVGVYVTPVKKILKDPESFTGKPGKNKIAILNSDYPFEQEITQSSGGNIVAARPVVSGLGTREVRRRSFYAKLRLRELASIL